MELYNYEGIEVCTLLDFHFVCNYKIASTKKPWNPFGSLDNKIKLPS